MDRLRQIFSDLAAMWAGWSGARKAVAISSVVAGIAMFAGLMVLANWQNYVPLMTNLTAEDAAQIVDKLQAEKVPYKLAQGGSAVLVPDSDVHELRLRVAGEGLPRGGNVGFEIFDEPNFGMSHFSEQLNYRRALEGELRRTIRQIAAVRDARVHIVVPEPTLFKDHEQQATAAVTLQLQQGRSLSGGQVQAIVHLVAAAVANLAPDHVTVVDGSGNILAKGGESSGNMGLVLERQRAVERGIEERVQQILIPLVGEGHVVVRAAASLNFSKTDRTSETFDPAATAIRSEQFSEEHKTPGGTPSGIPGSRTNLTGTQSPSAAGTTESGRRLQTRNYEINRVLEHEIGAEGRLARLSVAVLLDAVPTLGADGKSTLKERSQEELGRITELVRRAVGFDADRDDQVIVQSMPFELPKPAEVEEQPSALVGYISRLWLPALTTVATLVILFALLRVNKRDNFVAGALSQPRSVRELEGMLQGHPVAALSPAASPGQLGTTMALQRRQDGSVPEPEQAAEVLKNWLSEV